MNPFLFLNVRFVSGNKKLFKRIEKKSTSYNGLALIFKQYSSRLNNTILFCKHTFVCFHNKVSSGVLDWNIFFDSDLVGRMQLMFITG